MAKLNEILHPEDNILTEDFNFSQDIFDLSEPDIPTLGKNFLTPCNHLNMKFKNYRNLLNIAHVNARSAPKHIHEIDRIIRGTDLDILGISETFISPNTPKSVYQLSGYNFFHKDRDMKCRGGVGIYINEKFPAKLIKLPNDLVQPEMIFTEITVGKIKIAIGVIYKSPLIPYGVYANMHENLVAVTSKYEHCLLIGDMNIDFLKQSSSALKFFKSYVTEPFALTQVINQPTRVTSSTSTLIDLMLTSSPENVKVHGVVDTPGISDHCLTYLSYSIKKPKFKPKMVTRRDMRNFNTEKFLTDMANAHWEFVDAVEDDDIENKVTIFENIHKDIIDRHAPMRTFRVTRPAAPWLTNEIKSLMDSRDKYKNKFNVDKNPDTEILFKHLRNKVTHAIRDSKIETLNNQINTKIKNSKQFNKALKNFNIVESNLAKDEVTISPTLLNHSFLNNNNKPVDEYLVSDEINEIMKKATTQSFSFSEVTEDQVLKVVRSIKTNACGVDGISAFFLKLGIDYSVSAFTDIINCSFRHMIFPERWKKALVKPLPKVDNPTVPSDFRPISLLPAFSKVIEKLGAHQMINFLRNTQYFDNLQSAYKNNHSTITALLNVVDDIYDALEDSQLTFLVLLDYSKAFDCANHRLILAKLRAAGFCSDALTWMSSYLNNRQQKVVTGSSESQWEFMNNGVPQGSILGPLLFTVLVSDISDAIKRGRYHLYADDTQLYYHCKCKDANSTIDKINSDLNDISEYSRKNCLNLNETKSKYIIIASRPNLKKLKTMDLKDIKLNDKIIERVFEAKNLGITFDESLSWTRHINLSVGRAYGKLNHAYRFKKFLSPETKWNLCETYILSQFNYGDVILQNMTNFLQEKIQKVQNRCIRFAKGLRKYDHITATRTKMRTLNMSNRRLLHGLTLMFKIINNTAPSYLCERVIRNRDIHNYDTRRKNEIRPPFAKTKMRSNSFFIHMCSNYNDISNILDLSEISVITFKSRCKNYLLNIAD